MPEDQDITVTLTTPDGREADITDVLERAERGETIIMATTKVKPATNAEAVDHITDACRSRVDEMIDDLLKYVNASEAKGSIILTCSIEPVKKTPGAYWLNVQPALSCKGMRSERPATIERVGNELQLKLRG